MGITRERIRELLSMKEGTLPLGHSGLVFLKVDQNGSKVEFTTDVPPQTRTSIEADEMIDNLANKFGIRDFRIEMHQHTGQKKDRDITFQVPHELLEEVIEFIARTFYNQEDWEIVELLRT